MSVREATGDDVSRLGEIAEAAGLFPADYMPGMIAPFLAREGDMWRVALVDNRPVGFAFARLEEMADRTWNILAIAVEPSHQGQGHASRLLSAMETDLNARIILIETTQLEDQARARAFYVAKGYEQQGHIRDFYSEGEDKIVFRKAGK